MKTFSLKQIAFIYLLGTACFGAFLLPEALSRFSGTAAVALILGSTVFTALWARVLYFIIRKYHTLQRFVKAKCAEKAERVFRGVLCVFLSLIGVFYAAAFYDRLASTAFSYLPRQVVVAVLVLAALLFVGVEKARLGRAVQVVFLLMAVSLAALALFSVGSVDIKSFLPVKRFGFTNGLRALLYPVGAAGLLSALLYENEADIRNPSAFSAVFAAGNAITAVIVFLTQGVFGTHFVAQVSYPFFALIKSTRSLNGFEHFESLISGAWIMMSVCFFTLLLKTLTDLFTSFFRAPERKRIWLSLLPGAALLLGALFTPDNRFVNEFVLSTLMPLCNVILLISFPAILTLTNERI